MKLLVHCAVLSALAVLFAVSAAAQAIPNAGFESWGVDSSLTGWAISNTPFGKPVTPTSPGHSGSIALKGTVISFFTALMPPVVQSGPDAKGFSMTARPAAFSVWYKFVPVSGSGDRFGINVGIFQGGAEGTRVALAAQLISATTTTFTKVTVPFTYFNGLTPDVCIVQFQIIDSTTGPKPKVGSYMIVDDVALEGTSAVEGAPRAPLAYSLSQNYPNPFNPATTIAFTLARPGHTTLRVFDLVGQELLRLVDGDLPAGQHRATLSGAGLASGFYLYRLESGSFVETRRMVLLK